MVANRIKVSSWPLLPIPHNRDMVSYKQQTSTRFHFSPEPPEWVFRIKFGY